MSGLYPNFPDERPSGRPRMEANRRQELTLQMELDAVAMRSITEIAIKKEAKKNEPLTEGQAITR